MAKTLITQKTWDQTEADLKKSLRMWGAKEYALLRGLGAGAKPVPAGMKPVNDVTPAARRINETPEEATVRITVRWASGRELTLAYNQQRRSVDNFRVLYNTLDELRLHEVRGIDQLLREAYLQLPPPGDDQVVSLDPYEYLGLNSSATKGQVDSMVRHLQSELHKAGDDEAKSVRINMARTAIYEKRGWGPGRGGSDGE